MALRFTKLTRAAVRGLKLGDPSIFEHGIKAERLRTGDLRWSINVMVDGERISRAVGRESEGVTREQAERLIERLRTDARAGRLDLPKARKLHRSVAEAAESYLTRLEQTDGKDLANKRRHLRMHLVPYFGAKRLDQIKEFDLGQYRRHRLDSGATDATVNREFSTVLHMLNRAVDWKWLAADKKPRIVKPSEARKQIRVLSDRESAALVRAAANDQDSLLWLFVTFGLGAAMRHSEIVRVRWEEIDLATRRIWISKAKAGVREQPITPALCIALESHCPAIEKRRGYLFPARAKATKYEHRRDMRGSFERAVISAGLSPKRVTPHVMRHTAITRLVQAGIDIPTIQRISGHKTVAMVLHYAHVHGAHIDQAIQMLDQGILGGITSKLHTTEKGEGTEIRPTN